MGSIYGIMGVVYTLVENKDHSILTSELEGTLQSDDFVDSDTLDRIFGEDVEMRVFEDGQNFGEHIAMEADNANASVDRIHFHMGFVNTLEDNALANSKIRHRILVIKPLRSEPGEPDTGLDTVIDSPNDNKPPDYQIKEAYSTFQTMLETNQWENTEIRVYETTPWLRAAIIDSEKAGFLIKPGMITSTNQPKFWTEDESLIITLEDIFEDIWHDERTEDFLKWAKRTDFFEESSEAEE
jgi:hypothetical protein